MSMKLGVVLAAGEAKRLPNKALLPIENGQLAIESAINFCKASGCDEIVVVVDCNYLVPLVLQKRGHCLRYTVQPRAVGVCDAINRAAALLDPNGKMLVSFCDNIYREVETAWHNPRPTACIREAPNGHLDGWDGEKWVERNVKTKFKLAGWLRMPYATAINFDGSLVDQLNEHRFKAEVSSVRWHDIGTVDSYRRYLSEDCPSLQSGQRV